MQQTAYHPGERIPQFSLSFGLTPENPFDQLATLLVNAHKMRSIPYRLHKGRRESELNNKDGRNPLLTVPPNRLVNSPTLEAGYHWRPIQLYRTDRKAWLHWGHTLNIKYYATY